MASIERRSGGYRVRYRDPAGHNRSRTFKRKVDAERFAREVEVDMDRGAWIDPKGADVPLSAWVESFMAMCVSLSPTTVETYRRDLDKYVLPAFGTRRLRQLRAEEIERWLNDEIVAGIASSSVHRHYRTLRRVLQAAVEKERLLTNPCNRVRPPKVTTRKMTVLDWDQCLTVAEAMSPRYRAMIYLALDSGMRWSELVGLRRAQVDLDRRKVRVTEQLVELADRSRIRKEPKTTAGVRSITISALTAEMLGTTSRRSLSRALTPSCSRRGRGRRSLTRASRPLTSSRRCERREWRLGSTTCATRASRWRSLRALIRRRSRCAWATAPSP